MQTLFYPSYGRLIVNEQPLPETNAGEVLVKVSACGICGSELETFARQSARRKPPIIMGHEFCGVIAETGDGMKEWPAGMRVVSNSIIFCGECARCRAGETNLCTQRQVFGMQRNGAFAEYVNVPVRCLIPVPDEITARAACLTEPLANGVHMVRLTRHIAVRRVLIIGAGPIGLMAQQAFRAIRNAETIVADLKDERLKVAKQLGAAQVLNAGKESFSEEIMELTSGEGVDMVIDAVGLGITNAQALNMVRTGGTVVMIGLHENTSSLPSYDIILAEKKVMGTYAATQEDMHEALALMAAGRVDVTSWVHYYTLSEGETAFRDMLAAEGEHIKSVILF